MENPEKSGVCLSAASSAAYRIFLIERTDPEGGFTGVPFLWEYLSFGQAKKGTESYFGLIERKDLKRIIESQGLDSRLPLRGTQSAGMTEKPENESMVQFGMKFPVPD